MIQWVCVIHWEIVGGKWVNKKVQSYAQIVKQEKKPLEKARIAQNWSKILKTASIAQNVYLAKEVYKSFYLAQKTK